MFDSITHRRNFQAAGLTQSTPCYQGGLNFKMPSCGGPWKKAPGVRLSRPYAHPCLSLPLTNIQPHIGRPVKVLFLQDVRMYVYASIVRSYTYTDTRLLAFVRMIYQPPLDSKGSRGTLVHCSTKSQSTTCTYLYVHYVQTCIRTFPLLQIRAYMRSPQRKAFSY